VTPLRDEDLEVTAGCAADHPDQRGGQHVARQCTAVRIRHVPTGVEVVSRSHRSQLGNRASALRMLAAAIEADQERPVAIRWVQAANGSDYYEASAGVCSLTVWCDGPIHEWRWEVEINAQSTSTGWAATAEDAKNKCRDAVVEIVIGIQRDL
jgi:hypothetical protein